MVSKPIIAQKITQKQKMSMSRAMQQAFHILQMPTCELIDYLEKEIEQNPLFEIFPHSVPFNRDYELYIQPKQSLYQYLLSEIPFYFEDSRECNLAKFFAAALDEKGFLTMDLKEICEKEKIDKEFAQEVLKKFQTIQPEGLGAKDAREALLIQLSLAKKEKSIAYTMINHHYKELIYNRFHLLSKNLGISIQKIREVIRSDIKPLHPFPGLLFAQSDNKPITADIAIFKESETWKIELNEDRFPSFRIQPFYLKSLSSSSLSKDELLFMRRHLISGKWLVRILNRRRKTLNEIAYVLFKKQKDFFEGIHSTPHPMTMKEVAYALHISESTVARAVANKYLSSPRGMHKLRDFFTAALEAIDGKISNVKAKNLLAIMIEREDKKHPFSDQVLSQSLEKEGIICARRTVAKYRNQMKIPSATIRKEY